MRRSSCSNNVATTVCSWFIVYDPDFNAQECLIFQALDRCSLLVAIYSSACVNALFFLLQRGMFVKGGEWSGFTEFLAAFCKRTRQKLPTRFASGCFGGAMASNRLSFSAEKAPCSLSFRERRGISGEFHFPRKFKETTFSSRHGNGTMALRSRT